jgi:prephenate dehydrogenase
MLSGYGLTVHQIDQGTPEKERIAALQNASAVLFSVPICSTVRIINETLPMVAPKALLIDITSLKAAPVAAMLQHSGEVLGLHPMCAPNEAGLTNQPVVVCAQRRGPKSESAIAMLRDLGAIIVEMNPDRHDRIMAVVQGLNHFYSIVFAHALKEIGVTVEETLEVASPVYALRMQLMGRILSQDPALYADIEIENPYVPEMLESYAKSMHIFKEAIESRSRDKCIQFFSEAADTLGAYRVTALHATEALLSAGLISSGKNQRSYQAKPIK